jgi:hypothetical protein
MHGSLLVYLVYVRLKLLNTRLLTHRTLMGLNMCLNSLSTSAVLGLADVCKGSGER